MLPSDVLGVSIWEPSAANSSSSRGRSSPTSSWPTRSTAPPEDPVESARGHERGAGLARPHDLSTATAVHGARDAEPREYAGTHPLPESQLDRFLLRIRIGYPAALDEKTILRGAAARGPDAIAPTIAVEEVLALQQEVERVRVEESVLDYVMAIVAATRTSALLALGVSPRGSLALLRAAQAHALADGRDYLVPDDVKGLAVQALAHRVMLKTRNELGSPDGSR